MNDVQNFSIFLATSDWVLHELSSHDFQGCYSYEIYSHIPHRPGKTIRKFQEQISRIEYFYRFQSAYEEWKIGTL